MRRYDFRGAMAHNFKIRSGQVKYREDVVDGLENATQALIGLLEGRNFGKLLIKVS